MDHEHAWASPITHDAGLVDVALREYIATDLSAYMEAMV